MYREYADPFSLALDNVETLIKQQYDDFCANDVEDGYARSRSDELRGMYCEFDTPWMVYQNRPRYEYLCETHNLYTNIKVMETIGNMITVSSSIKTDTCLPRKEKLSNLDTVVIHKSEHNMGVFFAEEHSSALYSKKEEPLYKKYINDNNKYIPHGIFLFTHGATQRRSIGVIKEWRNGDEPNRVELPELPEKMKSMLKDIDRAPDGCGV